MAIAAAEALLPPLASHDDRLAPVRTWLFVLAALVVVMVAIGGATRLTGSGLSITEWRPVTGAIPPLSEPAWLAEFERYRAIPQYEIVNNGMSLEAFKRIYAWEWGHRQFGRVLGLVFFIPLIVFWTRGLVGPRLGLTLLAIGALGGLQAAVGWIMVRSGLDPGMVAVAPVKLTLHLVLASLILAGLVWIAAGLGSPQGRFGRPRAFSAKLLLALVFVQIALGGLVAGSKAGLAYNTWPLLDGALIPPAATLFVMQPWFENFSGNVALIQFNHRVVGALLVAFALWHAWDLNRSSHGAEPARLATLVAGLSLVQMTLGIATLILAVPLWAGLAHQVLAMIVLVAATLHARLAEPF